MLPAAPAMAQQKFITIGTGGVTGVYYAAGGAICRLMNKDRAKHGIRCSVESTGGSVFNVNTIRAGDLDFGVAQSDWQYHAYNGTGMFEKDGVQATCAPCSRSTPSPSRCWRARKPTSSNSPTSRASASTSATPARARAASMEELLASRWAGATEGLLAGLRAEGRRAGRGAVRQQDRRLLLRRRPPVGGDPGPDHTCGAKLVPLTGPAVDALVKEHPYYANVNIPGGMYTGNPNPTPTFGVLATLVTSSQDARRSGL